jgi:drug/metabolite transporter (DMT)-like permease
VKTWNATGALLCLTGMAVVGSSIAVSRRLLDYPTLTGQALRYTVAALILAAIAARTAPPGFETFLSKPPCREPQGLPPQSRPSWLGLSRTGTAKRETARTGRARREAARPTWRELGILAALAASGLAAFNAFIMVGLRHGDAAVVGTIVGVAPLGLALLAPLTAGRRPAPRLTLAAVAVVAGTALTEGSGHTDAVGLLASAGALGGEVAFSLLAAAVLPRLGGIRVAAWSCALAVPMLLGSAVVTGEPARWRPPTPAEATTLGYLAVMMTVVAFLAWFAGIRRLGVERAGLFTGFMPVATLVTAAAQDGRWPAPGQTVGVLVVAAALAFAVTATAPAAAVGRVPAAAAGQ